MFFIVRKIKGRPYLYKAKAFRKNGVPTNSSFCVGSVEKIENVLEKWRVKNE